jgi:hypothetical protein
VRSASVRRLPYGWSSGSNHNEPIASHDQSRSSPVRRIDLPTVPVDHQLLSMCQRTFRHRRSQQATLWVSKMTAVTEARNRL